jgi:hypothetical protein
MGSRIRALVLIVVATLAGSAAAAPLLVAGLDGKQHEPLRAGENRAIALVFVTRECPLANRYAPEIQRIYDDYAKRGIAFYLVYVDRDVTVATAQQHAREYRYRLPALLDPDHRLVKRVAAAVTPQAVVLAPSGKPLYRGRIDDRYVDPGRARPQPTTRDLRLALAAILAGKPVPNPVTRAVGCVIADG